MNTTSLLGIICGKIAAYGCTALATYLITSLVQTVFHRIFGHAPRIPALYDTHVRGHHAQYAKKLVTDEWIPAERQIVWYYAIPFAPIVAAAFFLATWDIFAVHVAALIFAIWWHVYLHKQYHIRDTWWQRFAWFRRKQHLHFVHHKIPHRNYAIVDYFWDHLLGTFEDTLPTSRHHSRQNDLNQT